jgi:carbamoyl-phosphate synthase small subunit
MRLFLEDNSVYEGESFGADTTMTGEVVFTTGMTGYVESLTDPSFAGQIVVCTYPLIGNYGVPEPSAFESEKIQIAGLVI